MILAVPGIEDNFLTLTLFLQNLSNALANGAVYALMALTVVMIYKTTGHLNFAQGEMAMFTTFLVFVLAVEHGFPVWLAIVIVVLVAMFVGAAFERILIQPLENRSVLAPVILTLGLLFILNGSAATIWGTQPRTPITNARPSVARKARPIGSPASTSPQARKVVNMAISPWAKFTMPVVRKISTSASASAPYSEPVAMPSTIVSMNSATAQTPR